VRLPHFAAIAYPRVWRAPAREATAGAPVDFQAATHPNAAAWREAIPLRHSRRSYDQTPAPAAALAALEALALEARVPHARAVVLPEAPQSLFAGILGSYGGISGSHSALAFVGDGSHEADAWVGYIGEALVLEATHLGLGTCWVGGLFNGHVASRLAGTSAGERVYGVSPLGTPIDHVTLKERLLMGGARAKRRLSSEVFAPAHQGWPEWARSALPPVRIAPSAMNRQPWRFALDGDGSTLDLGYDGDVGMRVTKRLDCGIAMLHAELGMAEAGVTGRWEVLGTDAAPQVARFTRE